MYYATIVSLITDETLSVGKCFAGEMAARGCAGAGLCSPHPLIEGPVWSLGLE